MISTRYRRRASGHIGRVAVALVGACAALTACSSGAHGESDDSGGDAYRTGFVNVQDGDGDPAPGGSLTYGVQLLTPTLDPTRAVARGGQGGEALAAVYDVLMQYDTESGEFEPKLAQSMKTDDSTTWTLRLRDDVKFSDGTSLDADAVVASIERYNAGGGNGADLWKQSVNSVEAENSSTVVFRLGNPWPKFPSMLALGHGMIVAPGAQQGQAFTAIGAGPFVESRFTPGEERIFSANPSYYGGRPHLDTLRMVALNGPQENLESLAAGQLDVAYIRGLGSAITAAKDAGYPGFIDVLNAGGSEIVNNRDGRPGADVRVRKAIAHAIDPDLVDQRAEEGRGLPGSELFGPTSQWHTDVPGIAYEPDRARQLLDEAKRDGYDGALRYTVLNEPKDKAIGLAVQSLLQAVGFTVEIDFANNAGDLLNSVYVKHEFDLAHAGIGLFESIPDLSLQSNLNSTSLSNISGYSNSDMDALLKEFQAASDDDAAREVIARVQQLWNETVPSASIGGLASFWAWQKDVHGVVPTATGIMLFDKAWVASR